MSTDAEVRPSGKSGDSSSAAEPELRKLGKYLIERKLGQGGMGAVYLARDPELRRMVAIKVLPRDKASNPILVRRFKAEAQAAAQLRHDNIVAVYDSDEDDGYLFIAMEFVEGQDLHEMISRRGTIPVKRSIEIIKHVAAALQHAHEHKIVHRDIKPSNLLIRRDGAVKLTDLGLARSVDDTIETGITRAGTTVGTVDYMAPEQARSSKAADIRSDIYSLGCTWYQMLTGHAPYPEGSLTNKLQAHAVKPIPDPSAENKHVTEGLVAVIQRMMAKKPEDRYQTPAELLADLEASSLTRAAFSQEILNAIDEESGQVATTPSKKSGDAAGRHDVEARSERVTAEEPDEPSSSRKQKKSKSSRGEKGREEEVVAVELPEESGASGSSGRSRKGPATLPPPSRRRPLEPDDERPVSPWAERMRMVAMIGGIIALVGGIAWLASGVGGVFDSRGIVLVPPVDPSTVAPVPEAAPPGVAAVTAGAGAGAVGEQLDTTTSVARVFSSGTPQTPNGTGTNPAAVGATGAGGSSGTSTTRAPAISSASLGGIRPTNPDQRPQWPSAPPAAQSAGFTVGAGSGSSHFASLNDALLKLPAEGGVIKLLGKGPFSLSLTVPLKVKRLTLLGDPAKPPLVILSKSGSDQLGHLDVQGDLEVSGVHFVADRESHPPSAPLTLIGVRDGSLSVDHSSLTLLGSGEVPITALGLQSSRTPQRLAARRTVVRGDFATAVELKSSAVDAVVDESLLVVGAGSLFRMEGASGLTDPTVTSRWLRCFASTLCTRGTLLDLSAESGFSEPPKSELVFREVLGCTGHAEPTATLLNVTDWPQQGVRDHISWTNADSSFLGFRLLLDLGAKSTFRADGADSWRQFWLKSVAAQEFVNHVWPSELAAVSAAPLQTFSRDELPNEVRQRNGRAEIPGVPIELLRLPDVVNPERLAAAARRPQPRTVIWQKPATAPPIINLREQDLGQWLAKNDWPDGFVLEVAGYGICSTTPVVIQGKKLKLIFRQLEGGPLRLMPKESGTTAAGIFDVRQGTLELVDFRMYHTIPRPRHPAWIVSGTDSVVILNGCELRGPETAVLPYQGLVRMSASAADESSTATTVILNSALFGAGPLVKCDDGGGSLFVRNSVLAADDRPLDVQLVARGNRLPFVLDVSFSTLSSAGTAIQVRGASLTSAPERQARWFLDGVVFAPPGPWRTPSGSTPTLLRVVGHVLDPLQIEWWGNQNGVAKEVRTLIDVVSPAPPRTVLTPEAWDQTWGSAHDLQLLTGTDGVVLAGAIASRADQLEPDQFLLRPACRAMVWADGGPIGANLRQLSGLGPQKIATPPANTKSTAPATPKPAPKKGVGF